MLCDFRRERVLGGYRLTCINCGCKRTVSDDEGPNYYRRCPIKEPKACLFLGEEIGEVGGCKPCGSSVQRAIHACVIHEECCPKENVKGVQYCGNCPDKRSER